MKIVKTYIHKYGTIWEPCGPIWVLYVCMYIYVCIYDIHIYIYIVYTFSPLSSLPLFSLLSPLSSLFSLLPRLRTQKATATTSAA